MPGARQAPDQTAWLALHERVLVGDPEAAESLTTLALHGVETNLARMFPKVDTAIRHDAAVHAVLIYLRNPARYDSARASLVTFLTVAGRGQMLNRLRADGRRRHYEDAFGQSRPVAVDPDGQPPATRVHVVLLRLIRTVVSDPHERRFLAAWCAGERDSVRLARYLGSRDVDPDARVRAIRLAAGRLMQRLRTVVRKGRARPGV